MIALIMTIPSLGGIVGSFFVPFFAKKFGKRNVLMGSMIIQGIGLVIMYLAIFFSVAIVMQFAAGKARTVFLKLQALILEW